MTFDAGNRRAARSGPSENAAGMRTLVIPHMVAHGRSLAEIAAITHVPPALVELIPAQPCTGHGAPAVRPRPDAGVAVTGVAPAAPWHRRHRKLVIWFLTVAFLAAAVVVSILWRAPLLPLAAMVIGGWLGPRRL